MLTINSGGLGMLNSIVGKKFFFAVGVVLLAALVCITQHYEGTIFRDIIIAVAGLFLGAQAYVDSKTNPPADSSVTPKALVIIFVLGLLCLQGCGTLLPAIHTPNPPSISYNIHETTSQKPVIGTTAKGEVVTFQNSNEHVYDIGFTKEEKPLTIWQKFCNWLSGFSILSIILLVGGLFLFPTATGTFIFQRYSAAKKALTQVVTAIDDAKAVQANTTLKEKLSSTMDNDSKKIVDDILRS